MSVQKNRSVLAAIGAAVLGLALPLPASAQAPSGRAVEILPDVTASRGGATRPIAALQPVFMGDRVQTGPNGQAQLLFNDNTKLVVGPGSTLLLEQYLLQSASTNTVSNFSVNALRGSFRFITGDSPKPSYAIKTPTATIGIRGTEFDLSIRPNGQTNFVLLSGAATVCGGGQCVQAVTACTLIEVMPGGRPRAVISVDERDRRLRSDFPMITDRINSVRQDFRASVSACADQRAKLDATLQLATLPVSPQPAEPARATARPAPPSNVAAISAPPPAVQPLLFDPPPPPALPAAAPLPGNPGNGKSVGNAGPNPGGGTSGTPTRGRSNDGVNRGGNGGGRPTATTSIETFASVTSFGADSAGSGAASASGSTAGSASSSSSSGGGSSGRDAGAAAGAGGGSAGTASAGPDATGSTGSAGSTGGRGNGNAGGNGNGNAGGNGNGNGNGNGRN